MDTLILRFRDYDADTIAEHRVFLRDGQGVWWGWWRKQDEPTRLDELRQFCRELVKGSVEIGIFDRSTDRFFRATVRDCVFSNSGDPITSPDADRTPAYYRDERVPAWFLITDVSEIPVEEFGREFMEIPVSTHTLFPVDRGGQIAAAPAVANTVLRSGRILHLSDLHFGADYGYPRENGPGARTLLNILANDVREFWPEGVGLVIISGDLSSRGDANVLFDPVLPFLRQLEVEFDLVPEHIIIVPGNHDIPLDDYSHVTYQHEAAYNAFLASFYGQSCLFPRLHRFVLPDERTLEVLPMNSVRLRSPDLKNIGYTSWPMYDDLLRRAERTENCLRMAVLHHHLVPAASEETLDPAYAQASLSVTWDAGSVIEGLQRHGFKIVLHGHQHVPKVTRIGRGRMPRGGVDLEGLEDALYLVSGGSAGARPERLSPEAPMNTYGMLNVTAEPISLEVRRFTRLGQTATEFRAEFTA